MEERRLHAVKEMAANRKVLAARLRAHVEYLAGQLGERNPYRYAELELARLYIERQFAEAGYAVTHDRWEMSGRRYYNVIAELPSPATHRSILIVGAHYDTVFGSPGADDNASGVAVLLELARLLRHSSPALTIRWAAFALEEPPYFQTSVMGSLVHARRCRKRSEPVTGMISLEMVGYYLAGSHSQHYPLPFMRWLHSHRGDFIGLAGNFRSRRLVRGLARLLAATGEIPVEHTCLPLVPGADLSDHWSFWQEGYPALMVTDTAFFRNPNYHLPSDVPETLDYARMAALVVGFEKVLRHPRLGAELSGG